MTLNTYLHFNGNCREAFEFYRAVFGGEFTFMETMEGGPADMGVPESEKHLIMHVSLPIGDSVLRGSDVPSHVCSAPGHGQLTSPSPTRPRAGRRWTLSSPSCPMEGNVTMEAQDMFWGSYFAACTDKFGIGWMLDYEQG